MSAEVTGSKQAYALWPSIVLPSVGAGVGSIAGGMAGGAPGALGGGLVGGGLSVAVGVPLQMAILRVARRKQRQEMLRKRPGAMTARDQRNLAVLDQFDSKSGGYMRAMEVGLRIGSQAKRAELTFDMPAGYTEGPDVVVGLRVKQAGIAPPAGYMGMTHQQYMPQYQRRTEFTPEEQELIRRNKGNVIPKIFKSQADSPAVDMASPAWSGLGGAGIGAALGAGLGMYPGAVSNGTGMARRGAAVGAGIGGVLGAIVGVMSRRAQNASIEESMRRLPAGAVRRDVQADPVYQVEQDRAARLRAAALAGGAVGSASKWASAMGMDPLAAAATGAGLGAALGGAVSFGNPGMMGRGVLAGGSAGYLVSAVDRIVQRRHERQRMEKPAGMAASAQAPYPAIGPTRRNAATQTLSRMFAPKPSYTLPPGHPGIGQTRSPLIAGLQGFQQGMAEGSQKVRHALLPKPLEAPVDNFVARQPTVMQSGMALGRKMVSMGSNALAGYRRSP